MQQVAASNKDIAAPGLFPGDPVTSNANGAGAEFAKVLENNSSGSYSSEPGEQGYRGHGDAFEAEQSSSDAEVTLDDNGSGNNKSEFTEKEHSESESEESLAQGAQEDDESGKVDDDLHDEWVSIIHKLNGDDSIKMSQTSGDSSQLEGGVDSQINVTGEQSEAESEFADGKFADSGQNTTISTSEEIDKENTEIIENTEVSATEPLPQSTISNSEQWKEDLKQKFLSSGHQLNVHQIKAVEKDLQSMSDEDIQKMLNDDQSFKQMLSDILNVQEPDPQDVALLLALAEQDSGSHNQINLTDLINENAELASGSAGGTGNQNENSDAEQGLSDEDLSTARIEVVGAEIEQDIDVALESFGDTSAEVFAEVDNIAAEPQSTTQEPVISNGNNEPKVASTTVPGEDPSKQQPPKIEQLLSELESSLKSDEQKLAAVENLTRRVESSAIGQTPAGKSFIDSMKQVATDLKEQLKSGSDTNFNLQQLVTDAVNLDSGKIDAVALEGQVRGALQQIVNVTQSHLSLEPVARENLLSSLQSSMNRDSGAAQLEAAKTQQQNLQNQILDKAVNMQKPEAALELANKVQVMMNQKNMVADIRLDPPDLGQMQIKIALQGDSASVSMVVQSQAAREALEHNQPRLKELLEQQGIELGQSSVQEESQGNKGEGDGSNFASGKGKEAAEDITSETDGESYVTVNEPEGIDYFA